MMNRVLQALLFLLSVGTVLPFWFSVGFDNANNLSNNGGSTSSFTTGTYTITGSNVVVIVQNVGDNVSGGADDLSSVVFHGSVDVTCPLAQKFGPAVTVARWLYFNYCIGPTTGTIQTTFGSSHYILTQAASYTGAGQVSPIEACSTHNNTNNSPDFSISVTTVTDNGWVVGMQWGGDASNAPFAGAGTTVESVDGLKLLALFDNHAAKTPAGSVTLNTTMGMGTTATNYLTGIACGVLPFGSDVVGGARVNDRMLGMIH